MAAAAPVQPVRTRGARDGDGTTDLPRVARSERGLEAFRPIRLRKAADEVVVVLIDAIRGGLFQPGDRLPRERDLALRLEVSRATVREAVAVLQQAGAVSVRRGAGGGMFVESVAGLPHLLSVLHGNADTSVRSVLELRRPLELQAAFLSAERATPDEIAVLWDILGRLERLVADDEEFIRLSMEFHVRIATSARNRALADHLNMVFSQSQIVMAQYPVGHTDLQQSLEIHKRIVSAIESKNRKKIIAALDAHFGALEEYLIGTRLQFP